MIAKIDFSWDIFLLFVPIVEEDTSFVLRFQCPIRFSQAKNDEASVKYFDRKLLSFIDLSIESLTHNCHDLMPKREAVV